MVPGALPRADRGTLYVEARGVPFGPLDGDLIGTTKVVDPVPNEDPQVSMGIAASASSPVASLVAIGDELAVSEDFQGRGTPEQHLVNRKEFRPGHLLNRAGEGAPPMGRTSPGRWRYRAP